MKTFVVVDPPGTLFKKHESGDLENLQKYVGGYIELCFLSNKWTVFVNEEGKLLRLRRNYLAEEILGHVSGVPRQVFGPAIFLGNNERSLTEQQVQALFSACQA